MRKRKLYLSELVTRYKENCTRSISIYNNSITSPMHFKNKKECLVYIPYDNYWNLEVVSYQIDNESFTIYCK